MTRHSRIKGGGPLALAAVATLAQAPGLAFAQGAPQDLPVVAPTASCASLTGLDLAASAARAAR